MNELEEDFVDKPESKKENTPQLDCSCPTDPYADLPPELRPNPRNNMGGLRKVTCPGCGAKYWTNRETEYCPDCVKKGLDKKASETAATNPPSGE